MSAQNHQNGRHFGIFGRLIWNSADIVGAFLLVNVASSNNVILKCKIPINSIKQGMFILSAKFKPYFYKRASKWIGFSQILPHISLSLIKMARNPTYTFKIYQIWYKNEGNVTYFPLTPKIRLEAYMLVNGCLQPILMIGKIRTSPSRMVGLLSLANYTVLPWRLKRTYNFAIKCSETDSLVDRAEDCSVRGSRFESLVKHFYINDSCNCITFDFKYIPSHSWESNLSFSRLLGLFFFFFFFFFFLKFWIFF